ncbi:ABC transporter permease [Bacillus halotolerans]|uniref:ABC transporter permease n=1 Tax=Bacillus halotolerans TaxID=260554 RepID=UPI00039E1F50|nr:ABC transporter permease [Bacillus halotolerans]PSA99168.1 ABC transporter permease [Bacillus halotolerans]QQF64154.1 ABC-2 transporter permease [Bacillus mojavensis]UTL71751.1 ABC transporter permease [Bacillus halotolerans]UYO31089.1 ABC transporter permease [Bacillus halotolerans]
MVDRGLLYREWKQNQVVIVLSIVFLVFANPLMVYHGYTSSQACLAHSDPQYCSFILNYHISSNIQINWVVGIILAVFLMGLERSKGSMDFLLSLPYTRRQIFQTKFWLGAVIIVLSQLIGFILAWLLILILKPEQVNYFEHGSIGMIITSFMFYSLVMAAGTLAGNAFAQLLTAFATAILPYLIITLPIYHIGILSGLQAWNFFSYEFDHKLMDFTPIFYVDSSWVEESKYLLLIPAVMSILFYLIASISFTKHHNERNGHFFLWRTLDRPIHILVIVLGILSFGLVGYSTGKSIVGYIIGMIIGGIVGFLISYFSIYKKVRH